MRHLVKVMSIFIMYMSILIYVQNIIQDYLEIRDGEEREIE